MSSYHVQILQELVNLPHHALEAMDDRANGARRIATRLRHHGRIEAIATVMSSAGCAQGMGTDLAIVGSWSSMCLAGDVGVRETATAPAKLPAARQREKAA